MNNISLIILSSFLGVCSVCSGNSHTNNTNNTNSVLNCQTGNESIYINKEEKCISLPSEICKQVQDDITDLVLEYENNSFIDLRLNPSDYRKRHLFKKEYNKLVVNKLIFLNPMTHVASRMGH